MRLGNVVNSNFLLVDTRRTAADADWLLQRIASQAMVIVAGDASAFLLDEDEASSFLRTADSAQPVGVLLEAGPHCAFRVPILDADTPADDAPDRCVVSEDGIIMGVFDVTAPARRGQTLAIDGSSSNSTRAGGQASFSPVARDEPARTWHLNAEFPEHVVVGETRSLLVSILVSASGARALPMALQPGAAVDLVLQVKRGFVSEGASEARLVVTEDEPLPVQFKLMATEAGVGKLRVLAFHEGQALGAISLASQVSGAAIQTSAAESHAARLDVPSIISPDLTLLILEHLHQGEPAFTVRLHAQDPHLGLNFKPFGPIALKSDPRGIFNSFFQDIEQLKVRTPQDRANTLHRLGQRGSWLFETLFPAELRTLMWSLRKRIRTVQIQSEEPWIPWEMCRLQTEEGGRIVEGPFFCEAFELTRWMPGIRKVTELALSRIAVIAPKVSDLPLAKAEEAYLLSLANQERQVETVPADYLDVIEALAQGGYEAIHFTGHGIFRDPDPNRSCILLEANEELRPTDIAGRTRNLGAAHPLVFLNACQSGRSELSLSDIGGWAAQFLRAGAGAFLGSYWSIYDQGAYQFAQSFYDSLLSGKTVAQSAWVAREVVKAKGDPTFLAYTVFAEPSAQIRV